MGELSYDEILGLSFDELCEYIGDGDPAEIIG
jgi:hypothetical protein